MSVVFERGVCANIKLNSDVFGKENYWRDAEDGNYEYSIATSNPIWPASEYESVRRFSSGRRQSSVGSGEGVSGVSINDSLDTTY
jgi:hypothetical protein